MDNDVYIILTKNQNRLLALSLEITGTMGDFHQVHVNSRALSVHSISCLCFCGFFFFLDHLQALARQEENDRPLLANNQHLEDVDDVGVTRKHSPRVTVPESGRQMYKATLLSLNQDPNLSHNRYVKY